MRGMADAAVQAKTHLRYRAFFLKTLLKLERDGVDKYVGDRNALAEEPETTVP